MAEIDIERKRGGAWVWVLGLAALALLIWLLAEAFDGPDEAVAVEAVAPAAGEPAASVGPVPVLVVDPSVPAPAVAAFVSHIRGGEARMGKDHLYTAEGIARMATALRELEQAHRGLSAGARAQAGEFYARAAALVASPDTLLAHADWVHAAAMDAAGVMEGLAEDVKGPVPELREQVAEVRSAAQAIQPGRDLLAQEEQVRGFFRQSADAMAMLIDPRP
ncbi:MAG TPA: hypothetical protein VFQ45_00470 [Longimicrobium sp.]|nr:hypothetical protein [Longimicrobium sp.]